ncbi:xanthine dehydrogenase family protein molybdopterin-binding subunit [Salinarimonas soli]|uniref:Xanthine dehydrogenase family protein molybdopterin-binding subunit n=1 Tax=Salinarimonas soli TaxID=1638099 RepID=A0A5B2VB47_9HYPH|nr:molybdopterin cofactor-binding domain-containing protein [Salinarimonas soli]KAA2236174.1 xanthine dehydrogenase family protein molybdopterin-binding subunit [Salinarimonas soli]
MTLPSPSRRGFLVGAAAVGGALVVGTYMSLGRPGRAVAATPASGPVKPNAFIRIAPDDTVTVLVKHLEMGQGVSTGLATIVAEELDASWAQMRAAPAPADAELYANLAWGPVQGTGGSTSIANSWTQLRLASAAARAMLVAAAAEAWGVPASEIAIAAGVIRHPASGRTGGFGAFAARAAALPVPADMRPKDPAAWVHIGQPRPRLDSSAKTDGTAVYSLDVRRPGMLTAVVAHPPRFGARVRSVDETAARAVPGVVDVVRIPTGVAVLGRDTWSAMRGRDALVVTWDDARAETRSSAALAAEYRALGGRPGAVAASRGDAGAALAKAARVIEAEYDFPYLAHAAIEPLNGTIARNPDGSVEAWGAFQIPTMDQGTIASILDLTPDRVTLHTLPAGGSFGRRASTTSDWIAEAAWILKASGGGAPIHLVWTREDDMRAGHFRPMAHHRVRAGLDAAGRICGWEHRIVAKSLLMGTPFEAMLAGGVDPSTTEGVADTPYAIPDLRVEAHNAREGVPVLWWRSVGHTHTAHVMETMIDELARAAGQDPVAFRLGLLGNAPRSAAALRLAAERAGWGEPLPAGRGRGVAVHASFGSVAAMVAEVTADGPRLRVDRIVAAVDCGVAVNPDVIRAQVEGSVGFALSAVLRNRVTLADGVVQETNFDAYEPTRFREMPRVEVHIVPSGVDPTGIGEPAVPPLAPAIANAAAAATGTRMRSLPLEASARRGA